MQDRALDPRNLTVAIKNIAGACGDEVSEMPPILDGLRRGGHLSAVCGGTGSHRHHDRASRGHGTWRRVAHRCSSDTMYLPLVTIADLL